MRSVTFAGLHHLKLPVGDLAASVEWYQRVLLATVFPEADHHTPAGVLSARMLRLPGVDTLIELRHSPTTARAVRDYDPITLAVTGLSELTAWVEHLDRLDVRHSPVLRSMIGHLVVVPDPDGVAIRLHTLPSPELRLDPTRADFDSPWLTLP
ncbi:VOC family protein [Kutzneria sp. 744]|uniref:VOC family protein n=1 Tax=Kutzneria sp. (strain 744) TaxID=345341 RepID=UPI0003EEC2DB|nr:VOC family protein [Kutzneria sp. 744]EWM12710.1 glyoxalase [Kutzneria sp. 744]